MVVIDVNLYPLEDLQVVVLHLVEKDLTTIVLLVVMISNLKSQKSTQAIIL